MSRLMDYLPEWYGGSPETAAIQNAIQPETDRLWAARDELLAQLDPNTATWGLALWEDALGIGTEPGRAAEYRRARVTARVRGSGTTTPALLRSVAESFSNGQVEVAEFPAEYRVEIRFVGTVGVPPNLEDLRSALDDVMPAHLGWEFVIYYNPHGKLGGFTHGELAGYSHEQLRNEVLKDAG